MALSRARKMGAFSVEPKTILNITSFTRLCLTILIIGVDSGAVDLGSLMLGYLLFFGESLPQRLLPKYYQMAGGPLAAL